MSGHGGSTVELGLVVNVQVTAGGKPKGKQASMSAEHSHLLQLTLDVTPSLPLSGAFWCLTRK